MLFKLPKLALSLEKIHLLGITFFDQKRDKGVYKKSRQDRAPQ